MVIGVAFIIQLIQCFELHLLFIIYYKLRRFIHYKLSLSLTQFLVRYISLLDFWEI